MTTTPRHGLPFGWPTWLTGLLSGDTHCHGAAWVEADGGRERDAGGVWSLVACGLVIGGALAAWAGAW